MKFGKCPKCGSSEVLTELKVLGGNGNPPFVNIVEPQPEKLPFMWVPKVKQSEFRAYICGTCGYTEFYAINYKELNEARKKGYKSS